MIDIPDQKVCKIASCSFCGRNEHAVAALIISASAGICNECTILSLDVMLEKMQNNEVKSYAQEKLIERFDKFCARANKSEV